MNGVALNIQDEVVLHVLSRLWMPFECDAVQTDNCCLRSCSGIEKRALTGMLELSYCLM